MGIQKLSLVNNLEVLEITNAKVIYLFSYTCKYGSGLKGLLGLLFIYNRGTSKTILDLTT